MNTSAHHVFANEAQCVEISGNSQPNFNLMRSAIETAMIRDFAKQLCKKIDECCTVRPRNFCRAVQLAPWPRTVQCFSILHRSKGKIFLGNTFGLLSVPTLELCYTELGTEPSQEFLTLILKPRINFFCRYLYSEY